MHATSRHSLRNNAEVILNDSQRSREVRVMLGACGDGCTWERSLRVSGGTWPFDMQLAWQGVASRQQVMHGSNAGALERYGGTREGNRWEWPHYVAMEGGKES